MLSESVVLIDLRTRALPLPLAKGGGGGELFPHEGKTFHFLIHSTLGDSAVGPLSRDSRAAHLKPRP